MSKHGFFWVIGVAEPPYCLGSKALSDPHQRAPQHYRMDQDALTYE